MGQPRCARQAFERGAGIGGHRVADAFEQRQVVGGIAVEGAALEVAPGAALGRQPVVDTRDLAGAERRRAADGAGDPALGVALELGGDQRSMPNSWRSAA
jgi:hypothetical protein